MKLNKQGRDELRAKILEQLASVPDGQKVHLKKEVLEELLFDTYLEQLNDTWGNLEGQKVQVKYLVWTGDFLKKLDLSEVSFDDVLWNLNYDPDGYFVDGTPYRYEGITEIDLSNTNVRIDFSKSFEGKHLGNDENKGNNKDISFARCYFANVDLSNNVLGNTCECWLSKCDFSNTGIVLDLNGEYGISMADCNFTGLDLSKYTINEFFFEDARVDERDDRLLTGGVNCNFTNTGLNIQTYESGPALVTTDLGQEIQIGNLAGCYINGKLVHTEEERQAIAQDKRAEYDKMKEDLISQTTSSIEEQITGFVRK